MDIDIVLWNIISEFERIFARVCYVPFSCILSEKRVVPVKVSKARRVYGHALNIVFVLHTLYCGIGFAFLRSGVGGVENENDILPLIRVLSCLFFFMVPGTYLGFGFVWKWRMTGMIAIVNALSKFQSKVPGLKLMNIFHEKAK